MKSTVSIVAALVMAITVVSTAAAVTKPQPWQWTNVQAAVAVPAETQLVYTDVGLDMELTKITCRGVGKPVQRRYLAFSCPATYTRKGTIIRPDEVKQVRVTVKMRKFGKGSICAVVGTVPAACLAKGTRAKGSMSEAYSAYRYTTQSSPIDDECYVHGSGFYSCWWLDSSGKHRATITFAPRPVVKVLS